MDIWTVILVFQFHSRMIVVRTEKISLVLLQLLIFNFKNDSFLDNNILLRIRKLKLGLALVQLLISRSKHVSRFSNHILNLNILCRLTVTAMAGRELSWNSGSSLSRSQSLLNMRTGQGTTPVGHQEETLSRSHTTIPTSSEAEGLELLGAFATTEEPDATSAHGDFDMRLLDYDSDTSKDDDAVSALDNTAATAMDTEQTALPATPPEMDATYVQCHAARISSHKDLLISVSQDETFGKTVSVQSACIGSLEDHGNLSCTFLGSRMMRGNCSRQSRRGLVQEDKRMAFVYTHGLFIT
jgi:hypothetical protein